MKKQRKSGPCYKHPVNFTIFFLLIVFFCTGCGPKPSSGRELLAFDKAGAIESQLDLAQFGLDTNIDGPYRVIPGDILEFQMPAVLRIVGTDLSEWLRPTAGNRYYEPYLTRVTDAGTIVLPIAGEIQVAGKTLSQIESAVLNSYYPKYVVDIPMIVCEVKKYRRENERVFTVMGLVRQPNAFPYPPDVQYGLLEALAFAGGLDMVTDPRYVKVFRKDENGKMICATFGIGRDAIAGTAAVKIKPGDIVYVDHTFNTRMNKFLAEVLQLRVGADIRPSND